MTFIRFSPDARIRSAVIGSALILMSIPLAHWISDLRVAKISDWLAMMWLLYFLSGAVILALKKEILSLLQFKHLDDDQFSRLAERVESRSLFLGTLMAVNLLASVFAAMSPLVAKENSWFGIFYDSSLVLWLVAAFIYSALVAFDYVGVQDAFVEIMRREREGERREKVLSSFVASSSVESNHDDLDGSKRKIRRLKYK